VFNHSAVKNFLEIDANAPEISVNQPKLIFDMANFVLGVRDFHYEPSRGILLVIISEMSIATRVDSYLTNMKMPWEKKAPKHAVATVGAVECYIQDKSGDYKFDKLWTKTFPN